MTRSDLQSYFQLMDSFKGGRISAVEFEKAYLHLFKSDQRLFPEAIFVILNTLFSDVDAFVSDPQIRGSDSLNEAELLECVHKAYRTLEKAVSDERHQLPTK